MSHNHPIDDLFNRKLSDFSSEPPMHLWEKIDQKRDWKYKLLNQIRLHKQSFLVVSSLLLLICAWQFRPSTVPDLGHFPIHLQGQQSSDQKLAIEELLVENNEAVSENQITPDVDEVESVTKLEETPSKETLAETTKAFEDSEKDPIDIAKQDNVTEAVTGKDEIVASSTGSIMSEEVDEAQPTEEPAGLKMATLASLETLDLSLEDNRLLGLFTTDPKCAKFKHNHWYLYLDVMASPDIPIRSLKARNNLYYNYVRNREQTESVEFSYSAGFRLSAVSNTGVAIRTGLNYTQINEQFDYFNESEERIIIDNIYGSDGEIIGSDTTVVTGVRHKVTHNRFQIVDLPIILGYELEYKKFILSFNGGPHINLYFESEGDFLSPELEPVSFSSDDPDGIRAFRNHLGIGWFTSVGLQYKVSPKINLLFEPYFKMYPKGFSRSQYIVEQQYLSTGFSIGIRQRI